MSIIELVRDIWMSNACVEFEQRSLNPSKVIALTTKLCGSVADENIIFPKTYVSREYNNGLCTHVVINRPPSGVKLRRPVQERRRARQINECFVYICMQPRN